MLGIGKVNDRLTKAKQLINNKGITKLNRTSTQYLLSPK